MIKFKKIKGNYIHSTAVINWKSLTIGIGNTIGPYVIIGNQAQWKNKKNTGKIIIGNNNVFNEYTNIHLPTSLKRKTFIGNNNYIMNSTTIDHDCYLEDDIVNKIREVSKLRKSISLDLKTIASRTKISTNQLKNIEAFKFDRLPPNPMRSSFINQYCSTIEKFKKI